MSGAPEKEFTVFLREAEFAVKAERFIIDDGVIRFFTGSTAVAAFTNWDGVI